jgi:hypothetical protein
LKHRDAAAWATGLPGHADLLIHLRAGRDRPPGAAAYPFLFGRKAYMRIAACAASLPAHALSEAFESLEENGPTTADPNA